MLKKNISDHLWMMDEALVEANKAYKENEVPIGAVLVGPDKNVISRSHNLKEKSFNPCGHAEMLALTEAGKKINNWRLKDCTLYVTLEPCPMCLSAMVQARIGNLVFGAYDLKGGALSLKYNMHSDKKLNHTFPVLGGLRHFECSRILSTFFKEKRKNYLRN